MKKLILTLTAVVLIFGVCFADPRVVYPEPITIHMGQDTLLYDEGYTVYSVFKDTMISSPRNFLGFTSTICPYIYQDEYVDKLLKYLLSMDLYEHAFIDWFEYNNDLYVGSDTFIMNITGLNTLELVNESYSYSIFSYDAENSKLKIGKNTAQYAYDAGMIHYNGGRFVRVFSWIGEYETVFDTFGFEKVSLYDICGTSTDEYCVDFHNNNLVYNPNLVWTATADIALKPYIDFVNLQYQEEYGRDRIYVGKYLDFIPNFVLP